MKTIAFIPVRGGSKSIPYKNIKQFCGKPLVYWTIKAAVETNKITDVVVATDSFEIENIVNSFSFDKVSVYRRNKENAEDTSSTESVILEYIKKAKPIISDTFILIQATSPLLISTDLDKGLQLFTKNDSVLSCVERKRFIWSKEGESLNYDYKNRPRRQDFNGFLIENGAFYISSVESILKSKNRISGKIAISKMAEYTAVEIDEEEDWIVAESLMKRFILNKSSNKVKKPIKLVVTDVDGVLTDAGMYYSENGDELKKFNTHDGMAFKLLREKGIKTGIVTSENTNIVSNRAKKLKADYLYQGKIHGGKLEAVLDICKKEKIKLEEVAYVGDDINCYELLSAVGIAACPKNALTKIKNIPDIICLEKKGGEGVFRDFVEVILNDK
ncbi:acylneuraminate cytidylyltransferase [Polaribacter sargassicola]|uniref:acylneuraminate cytidylyltransferase n=1 Tax=Polaribacter sargassicola TaxID=2836891 RepID=UPI001F23F1BD|nr:acylneuraminate cytidylyltransferase [Polaribacter sp. DS7-9]MCG1035336.1 acylneuraminate cytidylyltransferase [Polaribacter sp. DS7-9]